MSDVSTWSSDRLSDKYLSQLSFYDKHGYHRVTPSRQNENHGRGSHANESLESMVSRFIQVALVFNLAVGTKNKPVDGKFIGPGCALPILTHRLQRRFNIKITESIKSQG